MKPKRFFQEPNCAWSTKQCDFILREVRSSEITVTIDTDKKKAALSFHYDEKIIDMIKTIPGKWWVPDEKIWTIPLRRDLRAYLENLFNGHAELQFIEQEKPLLTVHSENGKSARTNADTTNKELFDPEEEESKPVQSSLFIDKLKNAMSVRKNSKTTFRNYSHHFRLFCEHINKPPEEATDDDISVWHNWKCSNFREGDNHSRCFKEGIG